MLDAKQIAKAIVSKEVSDDENGNGLARDDLEVAAGNVISASKSGNAAELAASLREFVSLCKE